jgi:hypothetical protein
MVKAHPSAAKVARRRDARLEPPPIIAQGERRSTSLERIRPQRIFALGENRRSRKAPAKAGPRCAVRRMNSTSGAFGRWSAYVPNEFGLKKPSAGGRPAPTGRCLLRRRRPTPGAERLGGPISIGAKAFGRRSACADREIPFALAKADARRASALEGRFQSAGRPPASGRPDASNEFDLQGPSAGGRPAPTGRFLLRRRRPTPGAQRLGGPISIGAKAFGRRSACADREGVLRRRRPTPGAQRL